MIKENETVGISEEEENTLQQQREQRRKKARKRLYKVRAMQSVLCLGLVALCVGTVVLATETLRRKSENATAGKEIHRAEAVSAAMLMPEEEERQTAEVKRPWIEV